MKLNASIDILYRASAEVVDTDNFDNFGVERTFIISRNNDSAAANLLGAQLGITEKVIYRELEDNYLDIGASVVIGTNISSCQR